MAGVMFFGISAAIFAVLLKREKNEYSILIVIASVVFLFTFTLSKIQVVAQTIQEVQKYIHFEDAYIRILMKIVGISYLTQFSSDICKDCGYQAIANQLQIFGKISVLAVSMPVVLTLLETIHQILG